MSVPIPFVASMVSDSFPVESGVQPLGTPMFASPGCADERVHYRCVELEDLDIRGEPSGDGSVMDDVANLGSGLLGGLFKKR